MGGGMWTGLPGAVLNRKLGAIPLSGAPNYQDVSLVQGKLSNQLTTGSLCGPKAKPGSSPKYRAIGGPRGVVFW